MERPAYDPRYPLRDVNLRSQMFLGVLYALVAGCFIWAGIAALTFYPGGGEDLFRGILFLGIAATILVTGAVLIVRSRRPFTPPARDDEANSGLRPEAS